MTAIDERARVYADRDWWRSAGNILGLELRGWTFRNEASFADRETGRRVEMPGWLAERILQALRPGSTGETEGWRDIETAGRELKAVLGYQATPGDWEGQMAICWPMGPVDKPAVWIGEGGLMPTHWMPLPSPPSAMLAAAGGN